MVEMRPWRRLLPVIILALVAVVPLWRAVFLGQAIGPFDQIRHMAPWNGPAPTQPWDVLMADGAIQFYPWRHMVFDAWGKGQLPLWNPYELAGTPLLANSQSAGFYPLHVLVGILHIPTALGMTLLAWFHLTWAGLGVFALSRRLGASRLGALIGGSSFALTPFMLDWTALPSVITTVAWIPWVLHSIVGIMRPGPTGRFSGKPVVFLGITFAMMALAGHLQFFAYGTMAAIILILGLAITKSEPGVEASSPQIRRWIGPLACVAGIALGIALAAPQLFPVLQYGKFSHRQGAATAEGYATYAAEAIKPFELANITVANALGSPREGIPTQDGIISSYWPSLVKQGGNLAESAITLSPFILGLMLLAPWKRRDLWPIAAIGVFALLLALGTPLNAVLYFGVPNWSATGSPARVIVLFLLAVNVIGALGVDRVLSLDNRMKIAVLATPLAIGLLFGLVCPGLAPDAGAAEPTISALRGAATSTAMVTILISSLLAALALALLTMPEAAKFRRAALVFPVVIAWLGYASNLVPTGEPLPIGDASTGTSRVAIVNQNWSMFQIPKAIFPPNTASLSQIHELGGYDSLLHRDTVAMLQDIDGGGAAPNENGNMMFVKPKLDVQKLAAAGVSQVYSAIPMPGLGVGQEQSGYWIYEVPGPGRLSAKGGEATLSFEGYDRQTIDVTAGTTQVIERDRMMPGWTDTSSRKELPDSLWRTIDVAPGQTKIELRYRPPGLRTGLVLSALGWIFVLIVLFLAKEKRKPTIQAT